VYIGKIKPNAMKTCIYRSNSFVVCILDLRAKTAFPWISSFLIEDNKLEKKDQQRLWYNETRNKLPIECFSGKIGQQPLLGKKNL
jgi:hypothetical protein